MPLKKLHDSTYHDNAEKLCKFEQRIQLSVVMTFTLFSVLYAVGILSLTAYSIVVGLIITVHVFLFNRIRFYRRIDQELNK